MLLKEKGELVSQNKKQLGSIMNKFFINITKRLNLKEDSLKEDIAIYLNYFSPIRKTYESNKKISFQLVTEEQQR